MLHRLNALLLVLKSCVGRACTHPWSALHPQVANSRTQAVRSHKDALKPQHDAFYADLYAEKRVAFDACAAGYIAENEGPFFGKGDADLFSAARPRGGRRWSEFV